MSAVPMREATLWDYYAAQALGGVAANPNSGANSPRDLAWYAASLADSMMLERDKRTQELKERQTA